MGAQLNALLKELERRNGGKPSTLYKYILRLSPNQLRFVEDTERFRIVCTSRRAGKSTAILEYLIKLARTTPRSPLLYIGLTRGAAKGIVWNDLVTMLGDAKIQFKANIHDLVVTFPNGSTITLWGADREAMQERLRGRRFRCVAVDEAAFFADLSSLVDTLIPTLMDYQGTLILASTPGYVKRGYFWECWGGKYADRWSHHTWLGSENPAMGAKYYEEARIALDLKYGGNVEHPGYVREFLGQWAEDDECLVYKYDPVRNMVRGKPQGWIETRSDTIILPDFDFILGLDIGYEDHNAIVVCAYSKHSPDFYVVDCWKQNHISVDELAAQVKIFGRRYSPRIYVADTGGVGRYITQELRDRHQLPILAVDKGKEKSFRIRLVNNDLQSGFIKIVMPECQPLIYELETLVKDDKGKEDPSCPNDIADAFNYAYIFSRSYAYDARTYIDDPIEHAFIEQDQREQELEWYEK